MNIPINFKNKVIKYYNEKKLNKKYQDDNIIINGVIFPKNIKTQHQKYNILSDEHINYMIKEFYLVNILHNFFLKNKILYTIIYGNMIGYYREKDQILWDDDFDILILNEEGIEILLNLWNNSGKEKNIWDNNWTYKNINLNNNNILLLKLVNNDKMFKIKLDKNNNNLNDLGGINIIFIKKNRDSVDNDLSIIKKYKCNESICPIIKFGPIETRILIKDIGTKILNDRYGKIWKNKNHPSLNKIITCNFGKIGMGNVMFKVASTYGISKKRKIDFFLGEKTKHLDGFIGEFPPVKDVYNNNEYYIHEKNEGIFTPEMFTKNLNLNNIRVGCYLQNRKYFIHCEDEIKNMFEPNNFYKKQANLWFKKNNITDLDIKVCIHIRRGDMMTEKYSPNLPALSWFKKVISKLPSKSKIILFSDDMEWIKNQPLFSKYIYSTNNSTMLDFTLMTLCNYFILSRGTFGWWAAYLSKNKIKVFYKNEFIGTYFENNFEKDYYPEEWEDIEGENYKEILNKIEIKNKPIITIIDNFDLINYYKWSGLNDTSLNKIKELCVKTNNNMWNFHICNVEGNHNPINITDWKLPIDNTKKLTLILILSDNSTLQLYQNNIKDIKVIQNDLYIFPSYVTFKCTNVAIFYANGNTFK